jgi:hypothetical protein
LTEHAPIRSHDELADYLRFRKEQIGISNEALEQCCGLTRGFIDKLLGLNRVKNLSKLTLDCLLGALAVQLIPQPDLERESKMVGRWETRDVCQVRTTGRISAAAMKRARPHLFAELAKAGGLARARCLPSKKRSEIARRAAQTRWRNHRRLRRELAMAAARACEERAS